MEVFVETDCTIEHDGRTFEAGGAVVTPGWLVAYPAEGGELKTWHGEPLGTWRAVSSWPVCSWQGSRMYAIRCRVDGGNYYGRGFGAGMILRARRVAAELKELENARGAVA